MPNYNHYTPQSDGSYRRSTVQESGRRQNPRPPYPGQQHQQNQQGSRPTPSEPSQRPQPCPEPKPKPEPPRPEPCPPQQDGGQGLWSLLRTMLPRQIDAADLLVISLLLLMEQKDDCPGELSPLLTIALYFLL